AVLRQPARQHGELVVVADQYAEPAERRLEAAQAPGAGGNEPLLALEARHDDLVLMADQPVRPEQIGAVAVLAVRIEHGSRTGAEPHTMAAGDGLAQVQPA